MSNYATAADLVDDILFRCGEAVDGTSDFNAIALQYLNRCYQSICLGGAELVPDMQEDWWWLRKSPPGTLILKPVITTGSVAVTNNNATATFSSDPGAVSGYFLQIDGGPGDVFRISSIVVGVATLDSVYTGITAGAATFKLMKLEYALASDVLRLISPMRAYRAERRYEIIGVDLVALDRDYPLAVVEAGIPDRYAPVTETTVRFNRYAGTTSTDLMRAEYDYLYMPDALTDAGTSVPVVPLHWRHVLSDWATNWLMADKNDDRAGAVGMAAKSGLMAMADENRHKYGGASRGLIGAIVPRQDELQRARGPLRTSSGLIIG